MDDHPDSILCGVFGFVVITSQPSDPQAEDVQFTGYFPHRL